MSNEHSKRMRALVSQLEQQGWTESPRPGRTSHRMFKSPQGGMVTMPGTPSDHRSWLNLISLLRRYGAVLPR